MTTPRRRQPGSVPRPPGERAAWRFVVAVGLVSLFGDFTYEGGRAIVGPYLGELGGSALLIGMIAGGGEFLGYLVRLVSGRMADRTGRYWPAIPAVICLSLLYRAHSLEPKSSMRAGDARTPANPPAPGDAGIYWHAAIVLLVSGPAWHSRAGRRAGESRR